MLGSERGWDGGNKEYTQDFDGETSWKTSTCKTKEMGDEQHDLGSAVSGAASASESACAVGSFERCSESEQTRGLEHGHNIHAIFCNLRSLPVGL
jgi:hypothetical protein